MPPPSTILCVDDEPIVLTSLREQFERGLGAYEIELAQDAVEALEILHGLRAEGVPVPVVISDHIMPGMKGDELLVRVHDVLPDTRTILLTGQAGLDAVGRAVNDAGLYRYISKPWNGEDLVMTVREAVRSYVAERQVREQQARLAEAHAAATRFVPYEFLSLLGRSGLADVKRGDFIARELSVYFSDIRSYTTLVEGHSHAENLAWINEYIGHMDGPIHRNGGFVNDIVGDAIIALFSEGTDGVVQAGIESLQALEVFNRERQGRGQPPLAIGIGVATGECLMCVIGSVERLKCGLVGDPVNLAARVEGLTKHLGTMLITGRTREALKDPGRFSTRYVDRVRVKGLRRPTPLYEVLDGLPGHERDRKLATADRLAEALAALEAGDLIGSTSILDELTLVNPADRAVDWHRARVEEFTRRGVPADWDGAIQLYVK